MPRSSEGDARDIKIRYSVYCSVAMSLYNVHIPCTSIYIYSFYRMYLIYILLFVLYVLVCNK